MYDNLFNPIKINSIEIKNRLAYPSLGLAYSYDGKLNDRYYNYFRERARGGTGLITVGPVGVDFIGSGILVLSLKDDEAIPSFKKMAKIIKEEGASPWIQLFHAGAYSHPITIEGKEPIAPSSFFTKYSRATTREMTIEDIKAVQQSFVDAAKRAKEAGFDGIEIIASAGYLITQFLSPLRNMRSDEYGGSFENRTRFPREIIEMIRKELGNEFPIGIRMAGNDFVPGSNTRKETPDIARVYEKAGIDIINVTGGWHEARVPQLPMELPRGGFSYLALNIKREVNVPVMSSNRISDPDTADVIIRDGIADMINLGRVLIADPEWPKKARSGAKDEIRPCVACSQGCTDQIFSGRPVFCLANPLAGFEAERKIQKTGKVKNIIIIGAGPGGLEAAVTASQAGHSVDLYEKSNDIGGQLWLAAAIPHKREIFEIIRYYRAMLKKQKINLHLNTEITIEKIKKMKPDHVIIAEGSEPLVPGIEGVDGPGVFTSWDILKNDPITGKKIAIIGGGAVGLETALFMAAKGTVTADTFKFLFAYGAESDESLREIMYRGSKEVAVYEMMPKAGNDLGKSTKWILLNNLENYRVKINTGAKVVSVEGCKVTYEADGEMKSAQYDNIIIASGSRPLKKISEGIEKTGIRYTAIGDCVRTAKINDAIHEGFLAVLNLDN